MNNLPVMVHLLTRSSIFDIWIFLYTIKPRQIGIIVSNITIINEINLKDVLVMAATLDDGLQSIDVICIHYKNGTVVPYKVRLVDEDGMSQEYSIKKYKDTTIYLSRDEDLYIA